jgi:hypothetical protein
VILRCHAHQDAQPPRLLLECGMLSSPESRQEKSQSPSLMETEPQHAKEATCDCSRLRDDRAFYADVVDGGLDIVAV